MSCLVSGMPLSIMNEVTMNGEHCQPLEAGSEPRIRGEGAALNGDGLFMTYRGRLKKQDLGALGG